MVSAKSQVAMQVVPIMMIASMLLAGNVIKALARLEVVAFNV